ncbi:hypothetical protein [Microbacterium aurum]
MLSLVAAPPSLASVASPADLAASTIADSATVDAGIVKAAAVVGFDPENIISDALFYDGAAMSSAEIQTFLDSKIGTCRNGKCLNVLTTGISSRDAVYSQTTGNLICSAIQGGSMKVSELIYRVQVACGISARVILVTLQKEQGLTTSKEPSDWNLKAAMGASCPDTAPCDPAFAGVGPQILKGTQQLKTYKAANFAKQPGRNWIGYNPNTACGGTNLNIRNYATAALYNYTPYQPNAAALAAGYGLGDGCSSYGNRNFYNYYTEWFGSTQRDNPFGNVESVTAVPGGYQVQGWAIDPNTADPIQVHVYAGASGYPTVANLDRPDVGAAYPSSGSKHGFSAVIPAAVAGTVNICFYGINVGSGTNTLFGCVSRTAMVGPPTGVFDTVQPVDAGVAVSGWAIDPDLAGPTEVHVYIDGAGTPLRADAPRSGLSKTYPAYGDKHGFSATINAPAGQHKVCAYAINIGVGDNVLLGCQTVTVSGQVDRGRAPIGNFDSVTVKGASALVRGWAIDPDTTRSISVSISVNGKPQTVVASAARADVDRAYPGYGAAHGFETTLTLATGTSEVCITAVNTGAGGNTPLGCKTAVVDPPDQGRTPIGFFESLTVSGTTATASGWALDQDTSRAIAVHLYVNGAGSAYEANLSRPDIAAAYPSTGPNHGFSAQLTLGAGTSEVCAYGINTGRGGNGFLGCRSVTVGSADRGRAPVGFFESLTVSGTTATASGWALDPDDSSSIAVHLYLNGAGRAYLADKPRADIGAAYPANGSAHGFVEQIQLGAGTSQVCAYGINTGAGGNTLLGCRNVSVQAASQNRVPLGYFESIAPTSGGATVGGWALDPDTSSPIQVHVYVDGVGRAYSADKSRPDVGAAYRLGDNHGFNDVVPMSSGTHRVCVYGINDKAGNNSLLGCRDVVVP